MSMYTREDILVLGDEFDASPYGALRRKLKKQSFYNQLSSLLVTSINPDRALEEFLRTAFDSFFYEDNRKVFFSPLEDMPFYINDSRYNRVALWRFKINK